MKEILGKDLKQGDVMLLPFGKTATVKSRSVGRKFVTFITEHGTSRIGINDPVLIDD